MKYEYICKGNYTYLVFMMKNDSSNKYAENLLADLFKPAPFVTRDSLSDIFDGRLKELGISRASALNIMRMERLTLIGVLDGTQKRVEVGNLTKIAHFLKIPRQEVARLYFEEVDKQNGEEEHVTSDVIEFINANFDTAALKKAGFIKSITNYPEIAEKICSHFGLKTIFDYKKSIGIPAFSATISEPRNRETRDFWITNAEHVCLEINNPHSYDREGLIKYFPYIRWHSLNVELGLINVVKDLFKLGITVIYQETLSDLKLRGATFPVNGKPCIVLSNYRGLYATLWFSLLHELYHVIFDLDDLLLGQYHLSEEDNERLTVKEKEKEADEFAREYLLPKEKLKKIKAHLNDYDLVAKFAVDNHLHPSLIYTFNAYDQSKNRTAWALANKYNPGTIKLLDLFGDSWKNSQPISSFVKSKRQFLYV